MIPSIGGRAVALVASAAAHAAVVVAAAAGGHSPRAVVASPGERAEVAIDVTDPSPPLPDAIARPTPQLPSRGPTHTHPYPVDPDHDAHPHDPSIVHAPHAPPARDAAERTPEPAPEPSPAARAAESRPPRFTIALGAGPDAATSSPPSPFSPSSPLVAGGGPQGAGGGEIGEVFAASGVSALAKCVEGAKPAYPALARSAGVEADVALDVVVDAGGRVRDAKVLAPVGYGLDRSALAGAFALRCAPAERAGRPVAVRMRWVTRFRLEN